MLHTNAAPSLNVTSTPIFSSVKSETDENCILEACCIRSLSLAKMAEPCDFETAIALTGFGRFNILVMVAAFISSLVCVMDTTTMAYVIPLSMHHLKLSSLGKGALNAITYAGLITSCFLWGSVSDTIGRIKLLRVALFVDGAIAFCSAFTTSLWLLLFLRFFVGIMSCAALPLTMAFVAEFHGMKYRSRCIMMVGFYLGIAQVILPALGLATLTQTWECQVGALTLYPWNEFIMLCSLPCLIGGLVFWLLPETPRFLMSHGRTEQALAVMRKICATNTGTHPDAYPVEGLVEEDAPDSPQPPSLADGSSPAQELLSRLLASCRELPSFFSTHYLRYTIPILFIESVTLLSLNSVRLWLPQLFTTLEDYYEMEDAAGNTTALYLCDAVTATHSVINAVVTYDTADEEDAASRAKYERIYTNSMIVCGISAVLVASSSILVKRWDYRRIITSCCLLSCVFSVSVLWSTHWIETVALFTAYLSSVNINCICLLGIVTSIYPTKLRATAVSMTVMGGYTSALIGTLIFPVLMEIRCEMPFYMIATFQLAGALVSFTLPYTTGRALR